MNPVWNQRLRIPAPNGAIPPSVHIKIRTGRSLGSDEDLAWIEIPLTDLKPDTPIPQTAFPVPCGTGINPETKIYLGFSYDAKARPWNLPKKQATTTTVVKKFTQGATTTHKSVIRELTKLMVLAPLAWEQTVTRRETGLAVASAPHKLAGCESPVTVQVN